MRPVVVLGDTLLDVDVDGRTDRMCPDAPVPVLNATASVSPWMILTDCGSTPIRSTRIWV